MSVVSVKSPKGEIESRLRRALCVCVGLPSFSYINGSINPPHTHIHTHTQIHTFSEFALPFHSQKSATRHAFHLAAISHPPAPSHPLCTKFNQCTNVQKRCNCAKFFVLFFTSRRQNSSAKKLFCYFIIHFIAFYYILFIYFTYSTFLL